MKKASMLFIISLILSLTLFLIPQKDVNAMMPEQNGYGSLFMGQNHDYYVIFRGNGEAIVYTNIEFTNATDNIIDSYKFEVPVELKDMTIYQYSNNYCVTCLNSKYPSSTYPMIQDTTVSNDMIYNNPDYTANYYTKLKFDVNDNKYIVKLSKAIMPTKQGYLLLGFTTKKFTNEFVGGFDYNFKTIKVNSRIENLKINITVDEELILKGSTSQISQVSVMPGQAMDYSVSSEKASTSSTLDSVLSLTQMYGSQYKSYKQVASDEVINVTGEYSSSWLRLYIKELALSILAIIAFIATIIVLKRKYEKLGLINDEKTPNNLNIAQNTKVWLLTDLLIGFVSSLLVVAFSFIVIFIGNNVNSIVGYGMLSGILPIIFIIITMILYLVLILFAPIYRGFKRGWASFIIVLLIEIIFGTIFGLLMLSVFATTIVTPPYIY